MDPDIVGFLRKERALLIPVNHQLIIKEPDM